MKRSKARPSRLKRLFLPLSRSNDLLDVVPRAVPKGLLPLQTSLINLLSGDEGLQINADFDDGADIAADGQAVDQSVTEVEDWSSFSQRFITAVYRTDLAATRASMNYLLLLFEWALTRTTSNDSSSIDEDGSELKSADLESVGMVTNFHFLSPVISEWITQTSSLLDIYEKTGIWVKSWEVGLMVILRTLDLCYAQPRNAKIEGSSDQSIQVKKQFDLDAVISVFVRSLNVDLSQRSMKMSLKLIVNRPELSSLLWSAGELSANVSNASLKRPSVNHGLIRLFSAKLRKTVEVSSDDGSSEINIVIANTLTEWFTEIIFESTIDWLNSAKLDESRVVSRLRRAMTDFGVFLFERGSSENVDCLVNKLLRMVKRKGSLTLKNARYLMNDAHFADKLVFQRVTEALLPTVMSELVVSSGSDLVQRRKEAALLFSRMAVKSLSIADSTILLFTPLTEAVNGKGVSKIDVRIQLADFLRSVSMDFRNEFFQKKSTKNSSELLTRQTLLFSSLNQIGSFVLGALTTQLKKRSDGARSAIYSVIDDWISVLFRCFQVVNSANSESTSEESKSAGMPPVDCEFMSECLTYLSSCVEGKVSTDKSTSAESLRSFANLLRLLRKTGDTRCISLVSNCRKSKTMVKKLSDYCTAKSNTPSVISSKLGALSVFVELSCGADGFLAVNGKHWLSLVQDKKSILTQSSYIWHCVNPKDNEMRMSIVRGILTQDFFLENLDIAKKARHFDGLYHSVLWFLLHSDPLIRSGAQKIIRGLVQNENHLDLDGSSSFEEEVKRDLDQSSDLDSVPRSVRGHLLRLLKDWLKQLEVGKVSWIKQAGSSLSGKKSAESDSKEGESSAMMTNDDDDGDGEESTKGLPSSVAKSALLALTSDRLPMDGLTDVLFLSHLQSVCGRKGLEDDPSAVWESVIRRWSSSSKSLSIDEVSEKISIIVAKDSGLRKKLSEDIRTFLNKSDKCSLKRPGTMTTIYMLSALFSLDAAMVASFEGVREAIAELIDSTKFVKDFSDTDVAICHTPEGQLCDFDKYRRDKAEERQTETKAAAAKTKKKQKAAVVVTTGSSGGSGKSRRRKRKKGAAAGTDGGGSSSSKTAELTDAQWEDQMRREMLAKSGERDPAEVAQLEKESAVRRRLECAKARLRVLKEWLQSMIDVNCSAFAKLFSVSLMKKLLPLSDSELMVDVTRDLIQTVVRSLSFSVGQNSSLVADCLILVRTKGAKIFALEKYSNVLNRTLDSLIRDLKAPDVTVQRQRKKRKQSKMPSMVGRGRGRGSGLVGGPGARMGRGRGRGISNVGRGRGGGGSASLMVSPMMGRGMAMGRGRGRGSLGMGSLVGGIRGTNDADLMSSDEDSIEDVLNREDPDDNDGNDDDDGFDRDMLWDDSTFGTLFPILELCLKEGKSKVYRVSRLIPAKSLSLIVCHCNSKVSCLPSGMSLSEKGVYFPCLEVSDLLLFTVQEYGDWLRRSATSALIQLSPAITNEKEMSAVLNQQGLLHDNKYVRRAAVKAMTVSPAIRNRERSTLVVTRVYSACRDSNRLNASLARKIWKNLDLQCTTDILAELQTMLGVRSEIVRKFVAISVFDCVLSNSHGETVLLETTVKGLCNLYRKNADLQVKKKSAKAKAAAMADPYGESESVINQRRQLLRDGCGLSLSKLAGNETMTEAMVMSLFEWVLRFGLSEMTKSIWRRNVDCGSTLISLYGVRDAEKLFAVLDKAAKDIEKHNTKESDIVRQGIVILIAALVRRIPDEAVVSFNMDERVDKVANELLVKLNTPSYDVQNAVARAMEGLMEKPLVRERAPALMDALLKMSTMSPNYYQRKGGAFGVAAIVKGLGIPSVIELDLMDRLDSSMKSSKWQSREGALLVYAQLFASLGKPFEPFVVKVCDHLLSAFGDSSVDVRKATAQASRTVMRNLTSHGVKMVLPLVLLGLTKQDWRTRMQACTLVTSMAEGNSKVLAAYLPQIVPQLCSCLIHPKKEVTNAAHNALKSIGSIVRNPEISALSPTLLKAIVSPGEATKRALKALIDTSFNNLVDVPSLALVIPILSHAMKDRSSNTKKMAAQVIGGISSLIADPRSLMAYAPELVEGVKSILYDPIPDVRTASALAIRSLSESLGESALPGVYDWLLSMIDDPKCNNVQRFGAAEGLSELLAAFDHRLTAALPRMLKRMLVAQSPSVRESYAQIFVFLPKALGERFGDYLSMIMPNLLRAMGDDKEPVRSVALQAGKIIVYMFHGTHFSEIIEACLEEVDNDDWVVRESIIILLGDCVHQVSGGEGSVTYETTPSGDSDASMARNLGADLRNEVLAAIYMAKADTEVPVRQRAGMTWKGLVYNSARMFKAISDTLMNNITTALSSSQRERQYIASRSLGSLVSNSGPYIVPKIIPILQRALKDDDPVVRSGVCLGLAEVLKTSSMKLLEHFEESLLDTVSLTLKDEELSVRESGAQSFSAVVKVFGERALKHILEPLIIEMDVEALREVLKVKAKSVVSRLLPSLIQEPLSVDRLDVLYSLSDSLTNYVHKYIPQIFITVVNGSVDNETGELNKPDILTAGNKAIIELVSQNSVSLLLSTIIECLEDKSERAMNTSCKEVCAVMLSSFCINTECEFNDHIPRLSQCLLYLLIEKKERLRLAAWQALCDLIKSIKDNDSLLDMIDWFRNILTQLCNDYRVDLGISSSSSLISPNNNNNDNSSNLPKIPGLCIGKGLQPFMYMFDYGLRSGTVDQRRSAAQLMSLLIRISDESSIKLFLNKICGALIRICTDLSFPKSVKSAILETLLLLLTKHGKLLRGFYVPLQSTLLKMIRHVSSEVRKMAGKALKALLKHSPKVDVVFKDLNGLLQKEIDSSSADGSKGDGSSSASAADGSGGGGGAGSSSSSSSSSSSVERGKDKKDSDHKSKDGSDDKNSSDKQKGDSTNELLINTQISALESITEISALEEVRPTLLSKPHILESLKSTLMILCCSNSNDNLRNHAAIALGALSSFFYPSDSETLLNEWILQFDVDQEWYSIESKLVVLTGVLENSFTDEMAQSMESSIRHSIEEAIAIGNDEDRPQITAAAIDSALALTFSLANLNERPEICAASLKLVLPLFRHSNGDIRERCNNGLQKFCEANDNDFFRMTATINAILKPLLKSLADPALDVRLSCIGAIKALMRFDSDRSVYHDYCSNGPPELVSTLQNFVGKHV